MTRSYAYNLLGASIDAGIRFHVDDGQLRLSGPPDVLTPEAVALITSHKPALLALLTRQPVPSHVPGIVWDPRGGVRVADVSIYDLTEVDPADPDVSKVVMLEQAFRRQAEQDEADAIAFFTESARQWAAEVSAEEGAVP